MKKEEVRKFVDDIITNKVSDDKTLLDFSELDSLEKVEVVMYCEKEYGIGIPDQELDANDWTTETFVDFLYQIIYDH